MLIGVLALQGAFMEQRATLNKLNIESFEIRKRTDLNRDFNGLILPGGESTVMGKLLKELDLFDPIRIMIQNGLPVMGTCAGLILLAANLADSNKVHFGTLPVCVKRNAYGRQLGSFFAKADFDGIGTIPMKFIRAPYIESVWDGTDILAFVKNQIAAVRYKNQLAMAFHPELTGDLSIHKYFIKMAENFPL